jgi:hypothetical protein
MKDYITVGNVKRALETKLTELRKEVRATTDIYERKGVIKERSRVLLLLTKLIETIETDPYEEKLKIIMYIMEEITKE